VLRALGDGGEGFSGWVMGPVSVGGMCRAFFWVEALANSFEWHRQGCIRA
jgi:hypothetical protein